MTPYHSCDLIVLSHLRWDHVFQRPQHLLTRFATQGRVFFFEEPVFGSDIPSLEIQSRQNGVQQVVPHLPHGLDEEQVHALQEKLITRLIVEQEIYDFVFWYYTPMALPFTQTLSARAVVYDCMDELSLFKGAHPRILDYEDQLLGIADVVFTGGQSLYEYKKDRHSNIHHFPSSIDFEHFHLARSGFLQEPEDQREIAHPRMGFFGVIDERMDLSLLNQVAQTRPDWQLVILGPVVKISAESLPRLPNIHYLGQKPYSELPAYIAGWEVALMPFACNDSTRFISPTKTPEYLAAGKPVVSTPIRDVVRPYGDQELVYIADTPEKFISAIESAMSLDQRDPAWRVKSDLFLSQTSWDKTWRAMARLVGAAISASVPSESAASEQQAS